MKNQSVVKHWAKVSVLLLGLVFLSASNKKDSKGMFSTQQIQVGRTAITVELADTPEKTAQGLMFRRKMPDKNGMLFVFPDTEVRHFWMKNTFIPLSIGFFDENRVLVDIQDMEPVKSEMDARPPTYQSKKPAKFCLEVNRGWFEKNKIKVGDKFEFLK